MQGWSAAKGRLNTRNWGWQDGEGEIDGWMDGRERKADKPKGD